MAKWGTKYGYCLVARSMVATSAGQTETEMVPLRSSTGTVTVKELKKHTQEITKKIEEDEYKVILVWKCEWKRMKKRPEIAEFLKSLKNPTQKL